MEDAFVVRLDIDAPRTVVERVLAEEVNRRKLHKEATIPWEGEQIRNPPQDSMASGDVFGPSMPPVQRFVPSNNGILRDYHGRPLCSILRSPIYVRAPLVEPHGTRIQPERNPHSIPSHPVRGLGPYGTVLLGDDGRPLVADLHPSY
ncbi:hypothetical protein BDQ12DRAFT_678385 [Crucibulum laeve]|uniref:Uncharacterized protein n=1 Tax=Crucibulum laeve TaxID=68775 RepID=A0A5C3M8R8_9AGAR|nr:hypothetical protein BDQ12DRAFT_678385 [Crucibulum laeve]